MYTNRTARELHARLLLSMSMEDAKEILGFPPGSSPSPSEVARAYKRKALENHPDRGGDPRKMVEVNVAKEVLDGKSRGDFVRQQNEEEKKRREALLRDLATIDRAKKQAVQAMANHSLYVFSFRIREPFRVFLMDDFAEVLDLVHDHAEKGLKKPASKDDEKALKSVLGVIKEMNGITLRIASKYRGLSNPGEIMLSQLEDRYESGVAIQKMMEDLFAKSRQLNGLLMTGLGPTYEDAISIPDKVCDRYLNAHSWLESYIRDLSSFDPSDLQKVLKKVEEAVTEVLDILKDRKVNPRDFDISPNWQSWDIPDSFDLAEVAIRNPVKHASQDDVIALRVAARYKEAAPRGKAQVAIMEYLKSGDEVQLTDMTRHPSFRGVHFSAIQSAAEALKKQGLIEYNGKTLKKK